MHNTQVDVPGRLLAPGRRSEDENPSHCLSPGLENTLYEPALINF